MLDESRRSARTVIVGLVADPGAPIDVAVEMAEKLREQLSSRVADNVTWHVETALEMLHLDDWGRPTILGDGATLKDRGWDMMVAITELPVRRDGRPMISEVDTARQTSWVSLPALGAVGVRSRLLGALVTVVQRMSQSDGAGMARDELAATATLGMGGSRLRLLAGMVRINRPWRLVGSLDNVFAAAAATGAFGVFYTSVWNMTDTLSVLRLALITVGAVSALVGWLIFHNGLWERPRKRGGKTIQPRLYNATTLLTLVVGVTAMYVLLFVATFLGSLIVISSEYLETVLRHPVTVVEYLKIAWIASSMGTVAGALGSNFESQDDVKRVAYGRRQLDRA